MIARNVTDIDPSQFLWRHSLIPPCSRVITFPRNVKKMKILVTELQNQSCSTASDFIEFVSMHGYWNVVANRSYTDVLL